MKPLVEPIAEMVGDGPNTLVITLKTGNVDFAALLSEARLPIMPAKDGKIDVNTRDGTGAYKLESFEPGVRVTFSRNENYWNAANGGYVDSAEIIVVIDPAARMNALRSREVDIINQVDVKTMGLMKRVPNVRVEEVESGQHDALSMFCDTPPFSDNNVRKALKYAINRKEIVDKVLLGHGSIGNDTPISKFNKYYAADIPQYEYDPDKVKYYLKQAGRTSLSVPLSVAEAGFTGAIDTGQLFVASARAAGVTIDLTIESEDGYLSNVWLKKPFTADYWGFRVTADWIFSLAYAAGAPFNETHFNNPRFNELLVAARVELDETKRAEMYREMQLLVHDDGGAIIPMFTNHIWAVDKSVAHKDQVASNWELDGLRCIERWWLEG